MSVASWIFAAALIASIYGQDTQENAAECTSAAVTVALKAEIVDLQQSNAILHEEVESLANEKTRLMGDLTQNYDMVVKLKTEISSLRKELERLERDVANQQQVFEEAEFELKDTLKKLNEETVRADEQERIIAKLERELAIEQETRETTASKLEGVMTKLALESKKVAEMENTRDIMEKRNKALVKELSKATIVEPSLIALLSSYYDVALTVAEEAVSYVQAMLNEHQTTLEFVQIKVESAKKILYETSSKFYDDKLATTIDPILVSLHEVVDPILRAFDEAMRSYIQKYLPVVQTQARKAKELVILYLQEGLRRAKLARLQAILLLEQNEYITYHAQLVVDGMLIIITMLLMVIQIRSGCFQTHERNQKTKHKAGKKTASVNQSLNAPLKSKKRMQSGTTSTKRNSHKKNKN